MQILHTIRIVFYLSTYVVVSIYFPSPHRFHDHTNFTNKFLKFHYISFHSIRHVSVCVFWHSISAPLQTISSILFMCQFYASFSIQNITMCALHLQLNQQLKLRNKFSLSGKRNYAFVFVFDCLYCICEWKISLWFLCIILVSEQCCTNMGFGKRFNSIQSYLKCHRWLWYITLDTTTDSHWDWHHHHHHHYYPSSSVLLCQFQRNTCMNSQRIQLSWVW